MKLSRGDGVELKGSEHYSIKQRFSLIFSDFQL
jgi:hypothetical protein